MRLAPAFNIPNRLDAHRGEAPRRWPEEWSSRSCRRASPGRRRTRRWASLGGAVAPSPRSLRRPWPARSRRRAGLRSARAEVRALRRLRAGSPLRDVFLADEESLAQHALVGRPDLLASSTRPGLV